MNTGPARSASLSHRMRTSIALLHALLFIGCSAGVEDRDSGPDFAGTGDIGDDGSGSPSGAGSGAADGSDSGDGGGDGPGDGSGDGSDSSGPATPTARCDKIDFLVVVESAWADEVNGNWVYYDSYGKLREGFESLVSSLYVEVEVEDFRVLVTASSPASEEVICDPALDQCPADYGLDACDVQLGAGRNGFAVPDWGVMECMEGRFLESGQPDIPAAFSCLVEWWWYEDGLYPYYAGDEDDRLMDAMSLALGEQAQPGQCNAGFLRDDALLVVLLLEQGGDGQPDVSSGTVESWREAIVGAKQGNEGNVVVLGLAPDGGTRSSLCSPSESDELGAKVRSLVEGFPNHKWASSCLPDYVPFFDVAAEVIDGACEEFTPEG